MGGNITHRGVAMRAGRSEGACSSHSINVPIRRGFEWGASDAIQRAERDAVAALDGLGRVLLRPSGTESVLRVMVEARDADVADRCAKGIAEVVAKAAL